MLLNLYCMSSHPSSLVYIGQPKPAAQGTKKLPLAGNRMWDINFITGIIDSFLRSKCRIP